MVDIHINFDEDDLTRETESNRSKDRTRETERVIVWVYSDVGWQITAHCELDTQAEEQTK